MSTNKVAFRRKFTTDAQQPNGTPSLGAVTHDSFVNFAMKMGVGADNALTSSTYGFNPITRNRTLMEWIYRGTWIGGLAVDIVADDMTRAGIDYVSEMPPEATDQLDEEAETLDVWGKINEAIKWGRLYGGAICVALVDGQDMRTPLRLETIQPGQFKGLITLDRWMLEPTTTQLVDELGPHLGQPEFYRVTAAAPALRGQVIHHSRVIVRHEGVRLPWQQRVTENMWGISVIERLYDRMTGFDMATTGAAQLITKSYLRTMKVKDMRDVAAAGGAPLDALTRYMDIVRRFQGIEGITLVDGEDEFEVQGHSAFSGLSDALVQFGQQLSGALQIPLVRLFGQSPAGLNSTGESDLRTYYDNIAQRQKTDLRLGIALVYRLLATNRGVQLPPNFRLGFTSLWDLDANEKATVAKTNADAVQGALDSGIIGRKTALKELRQQSRVTGVFTNITTEMIESATDDVEPPIDQSMLNGLMAEPGTPIPGINDNQEQGNANGNPAATGTAVGKSPVGGNTVPKQPPADQQAGGSTRKRFAPQ